VNVAVEGATKLSAVKDGQAGQLDLNDRQWPRFLQEVFDQSIGRRIMTIGQDKGTG
jgi:hypothetical protein